MHSPERLRLNDEIASLLLRREEKKVVLAQCIRQVKTEKSEANKAALISVQRDLTLLNAQLHEAGERSHAMTSAGVAKTKAEMAGAFLAWAEQMEDANKNPRTPPAEKLFNAAAIARIRSILISSPPDATA